MKTFEQIEKLLMKERCTSFTSGKDGLAVLIQKDNESMGIIASWGSGWDHVSISFMNRCPTWDEMCWIKDLFWFSEETVMQLHPPESAYVNQHPYCLHLWKPQKHNIPLPPIEFVGVVGD